MLVVESLFLTGIDKDSNKNELKSLPILLAGAILFDLKLLKKISITQTGSLIKDPLIHLENATSTGNIILHQAIDTINSKSKDLPIQLCRKNHIIPNLFI